MDDEVKHSLTCWLNAFSENVRNRNFDGGRALFSDQAIGYGTWTSHMVGLDNLVQKQWCNVWPQTEDFTFDLEHAHFWVDHPDKPSLATIAALWSSRGVNENQEKFIRRGRSTTVLQRGPQGQWQAVHTHYSFAPLNNINGKI